ncbi:MAG: hypothetical protein WCS38_10180, partial [Mesotoga sp.]
MTEYSIFALIVSCHPAEPALKTCPKILLFGVSVQGFCLGSPVQGHPELVSGSGFEPIGAAGRWLQVR